MFAIVVVATAQDELPHLERQAERGSELRVVVSACCERAAAAARDKLNAASVHEARRSLKRARAVLRLGEELGVGGTRAARHRLSRLGRRLAPLRDVSVVAKVARKLGMDMSVPVPAPSTGQRGWVAWRDELRGKTQGLQRLRWGHPDGGDLRRALSHGARRICKRAQEARESREILAAHEWRKAAIVLREQIAVTRRATSDGVDRVQAQLVKLAKDLGAMMDYTVFLSAMATRADAVGGTEACRVAEKKRDRALKCAWNRWPKLRRMLRRMD